MSTTAQISTTQQERAVEPREKSSIIRVLGHSIRRENLPDERPEPSGRWNPFSHRSAASMVAQAIESLGYRITGETHVVSRSRCRWIGAFSIDFGFGDTPLEGISEVGIVCRSSIDKSESFRLLFGASVVFCGNGMVWGAEAEDRKKHVFRRIPDDVIEFSRNFLTQRREDCHRRWNRILSLRNTLVENPEKMVVGFARQGIIPASDIIRVLDFWDNPASMSTPETADESTRFFVPQSAFAMYQAVTAVIRDAGRPLTTVSRAERALSEFIPEEKPIDMPLFDHVEETDR